MRGQSVIGRVFGAKTVSSATAKEMKSSEKYKAKLAEVKAERDRLKKRVDEQEDEVRRSRHRGSGGAWRVCAVV